MYITFIIRKKNPIKKFSSDLKYAQGNRNEKIGWNPGHECLQAPPWESVHSFKELFLMFGSKHLDDVMDTVTPTSPSPSPTDEQ